jgi:hypothetical protein
MISFADYEQLIFSSPDSQQTKDKLTAGETSNFLPFEIYFTSVFGGRSAMNKIE